jgi:hypothetical protein
VTVYDEAMAEQRASTTRMAREAELLRQVTERLRRQFPELPAQQIDATVHGNYDAFEGSRIRDFIPVLVERATRQELSGSTYRRA